MVTRRQFSAVIGAFAASTMRAAGRIPVALQLFSVRKQCEADLHGTLAYVRDVGFEGVELAGFYGRSAKEFRDLLDKNSLKCCGSHTPLQQLTGENFEKTVEYSRTLGNRNLIVPGLPKEYEGSAAGWESAAERLNEIAERLRASGMRVGYHNHDIEFRMIEGVVPWAVLFERTRPEVILQLDMGNARIGGADPTALIRQYPGRAVTVHVKDYSREQTDPVIGSSNFDWTQFLKACESGGATEWYIIEHDSPKREEAKACLDRFREFQAAASA